jgi:hypothetical protein
MQTNGINGTSRAVAIGELDRLTDDERVAYYHAVCESVGLNPLTRPLEYLVLNGKLTLYAKRDATDQLRQKYQVSIEIIDRTIQDNVYVVRARASMADGRTDESLGAVHVGGLHGEDLANALMKAETKAKRRVALSICGLGMLDETEVDTIRSRVTIPDIASPDPASGDASTRPIAATILRAWDSQHPTSRSELYQHVKQAYGKRVVALTAEEVVDVLQWITAHEPPPIEQEGDSHAA